MIVLSTNRALFVFVGTFLVCMCPVTHSAFAQLSAPPSTASGSGRASLKLQVDRHIVQVGETIRINVTIQIEGGAGDQFERPKLSGFRLTASGTTSSATSWINGHVTTRRVQVFEAVAERPGSHSVGPARLRLGAKWIESNIARVEVRSGSASSGRRNRAGNAQSQSGSSNSGRTGSDPSDVPFGLRARQGVLPSTFVHGEPSSKNVYVNQQIVVDWRLYVSSSLSDVRLTKLPETEDFWAEELHRASPMRFVRQSLGGTDYYWALIRRVALFPQKAGKLVVGSLHTRLWMRGDIGSRTRASEPIEVNVLPLPEKGKPSNFPESNVGNFEIASMLDRDQVKIGDAVTFRVVVSGDGNLSQLTLPKLGSIDGFKVYEPKITEQPDHKGAKLRGERIAEYLLLPSKKGKHRLPVLSLPFFEPHSKTYREAKTETLELTVTGAPLLEGSRPLSSSKENRLEVDIRPPASGGSLLVHREARRSGLTFPLLMMVVPPILLLGVAGVNRVRARMMRPSRRSRNRASAKRVRKLLADAEGLQQREELPRFFATLADALHEQLGNLLGRTTEGLTRDELRSVLSEQGLDRTLVNRVVAELDNADFARFSPSASGRRETRDAIARVQQLVFELSASGREHKGRAS